MIMMNSIKSVDEVCFVGFKGLFLLIFISKVDKKTDFRNPPHCGGRRLRSRNKPYNTDFVKTL